MSLRPERDPLGVVHHTDSAMREAGDTGAQLRAAARMTRGGGPPISCDRCGQTTYWWLDKLAPGMPWRCSICTPEPREAR